MPKPTSYDLHVDQVAQNFSLAFLQDQSVTVSDKVFPLVLVNAQSGTYFIYSKEDLLRIEVEKRIPGAESAGGGWTATNTGTYACVEYGLHVDLDKATVMNASSPIDPIRDTTEYLTRNHLMKAEKLWIDSYFGDVWTTKEQGYAHGATAKDFVQWDDYVYSTPLEDIDAYRIVMEELTGFSPNTLVLSPYVYAALRQHPSIKEDIKYTQPSYVTSELMAKALDIDRIFVPRMIYNSTVEGATASYGYMASTKGALLCYSAPNPGLRVPSAGYTLRWSNMLGTGAEVVMESIDLPTKRSTRYDCSMAFDHKLVSADLGIWLYDVVTA